MNSIDNPESDLMRVIEHITALPVSKNIVITGVKHLEVYKEVVEDMKMACPEVLVKNYTIQYPEVGYSASEVKPRRNEAHVHTFRRGCSKLNIISIRNVVGLSEVWLEMGLNYPSFTLLHSVNKDNDCMVLPEDRPHVLWSSLVGMQPKGAIFLLHGEDNVTRQVGNYLDITLSQDFVGFRGFLLKVIQGEQSSYRRSHAELIARRLYSPEQSTIITYSLYEMIDRMLDQHGLTCLELSDPGVRARPKQPVRALRQEFEKLPAKIYNSQPWNESNGRMYNAAVGERFMPQGSPLINKHWANNVFTTKPTMSIHTVTGGSTDSCNNNDTENDDSDQY